MAVVTDALLQPIPIGNSRSGPLTDSSFIAPPDRVLVSRLRVLAYGFAALVAATGLLAILGWILDNEVLRGGVIVRGINIKTNTAIGLALVGLALLLRVKPPRSRKWRPRLASALAAIAGLIGLATLCEHIFGWNLGIDQLLFREMNPGLAVTSPNRMGPPASICFPLLGAALILMDRPVRSRQPSQMLALTAMMISLVPILGYIFRVNSLYGVARFTGIAFNTAIAFFLLGLGILFSRPEVGVVRRLFADDSGGVLLRRMVPWAILLPIGLAWLRVQGEQIGLYDLTFGRTLLVLSFIVAFSMLTWWTAIVVSRHEAARRLAEASEVEMKDKLLKSLESERAARTQAEKSNRTKDEFLATLSHELRTPLQSILGWSLLLKRESLPPEEAQRAVETIERNAQLQAQLIEDLLDMSRIISGKIRLEVGEVDLAHVLEAAHAAVAPAAAARSIQIDHRLDANVPLVRGDAARLQQVMWNLLTNAIKFTPRGGYVTITLRNAFTHVELVVTDTGVGIRPELISEVFERFRQADGSTTRQHAGLGLGLSISRQLIELHGGTLVAHSEGENRGASFTIRLPNFAAALLDAGVTSTGAPPAATPEPDQPFVRLDGVRVLVVDDQADARELIERVLVGRFARVTCAGSVDEALAVLERTTFDVLISDIGMPDRDGYDLIRAARLRGDHLPAIALTAFARAEDRDLTSAAGFQLHLAKPVSPAQLAAAVERVMRRAAEQQRS